jgi:hypothetical protein
VEFVVDEVALRQVFSEYFGHHSTNCSTITTVYHLGLVAGVPSGLSFTSLGIIKENIPGLERTAGTPCSSLIPSVFGHKNACIRHMLL